METIAQNEQRNGGRNLTGASIYYLAGRPYRIITTAAGKNWPPFKTQTSVTSIFEMTKEKHRFSCRYTIKIRVDGNMLVC